MLRCVSSSNDGGAESCPEPRDGVEEVSPAEWPPAAPPGTNVSVDISADGSADTSAGSAGSSGVPLKGTCKSCPGCIGGFDGAVGNAGGEDGGAGEGPGPGGWFDADAPHGWAASSDGFSAYSSSLARKAVPGSVPAQASQRKLPLGRENSSHTCTRGGARSGFFGWKLTEKLVNWRRGSIALVVVEAQVAVVRLHVVRDRDGVVRGMPSCLILRPGFRHRWSEEDLVVKTDIGHGAASTLALFAQNAENFGGRLQLQRELHVQADCLRAAESRRYTHGRVERPRAQGKSLPQPARALSECRQTGPS